MALQAAAEIGLQKGPEEAPSDDEEYVSDEDEPEPRDRDEPEPGEDKPETRGQETSETGDVVASSCASVMNPELKEGGVSLTATRDGSVAGPSGLQAKVGGKSESGGKGDCDEDSTSDEELISDDDEDSDDDKDISGANREFRPFRDEAARRKENAHVTRARNADSTASSPRASRAPLDRDEVKARVKSERQRERERQKKRRMRKAGEAAQVNRARREHRDNIKTSLGAGWY